MTLPSDTYIAELDKLITDQTRQNFLAKYGTMQSLRPDAMFNALGEQMVNPTALQNATQAMADYDRVFARGGGYRSRGLQAKRDVYLTDIDKKRQETINQFIESQKDLFNKWYTKEMYNYQTSKVPSQYTLGKFGITNAGGTTDSYTVQPNQPKYEYKTPYNAQNIFKYGGYAKPRSLYNMPTPI